MKLRIAELHYTLAQTCLHLYMFCQLFIKLWHAAYVGNYFTEEFNSSGTRPQHCALKSFYHWYLDSFGCYGQMLL